MSLRIVLLRVVLSSVFILFVAHAIPISARFHSTSGYMDNMRPSLPIWWDAPAMTDVEPDEESAAEALKRMCAERAIVEPVLVHIRDLWDEVDSAEPLDERAEIHQWHWAKRWNKARKALAEDLLMVQNDNHEMWLATIDPMVGDWTVDEEEKKHRGRCVPRVSQQSLHAEFHEVHEGRDCELDVAVLRPRV